MSAVLANPPYRHPTPGPFPESRLASMPQPTDTQRPPRFLMALWFSFIRFIANLFNKSPSPSPAALPTPVTARSPITIQPPGVSHQRINFPNAAWVMEPTPLKRPASATSSSPTPARRSRSATPGRSPTNPEHVFHPPASPFSNISLSGIFATPPLLASPYPAFEIELGRPSLTSPPDVPSLAPVLSPGSPSPSRGSHGVSSPSCRTLHSTSPYTPSSAVMVRLDRSELSPTTMSDGSLEVISLGDRRGFVGSPVKVVDIGRLPSPWSPIGRTISSDVWMSADGLLMNASGPVDDNSAQFQDDSTALMAPMLSPFTMSRISSTSLYSSPSVLDAFGISVFVNLDEVGDALSSAANNVDVQDDPISVPKLSKVLDESRPTLVTQGPQTPRKRRETIPSVTKSRTPSHSARAAKCLSTPPTKLNNVEINDVRSVSSISSMAYELRLGLFADGRSMTAIKNIISLLDQASPESIPLHNGVLQPVEAS